MDIEDAFTVIGKFGKFQVTTTALIFMCNIFFGMQIVLMVLVGATPDISVKSESNLTTIVTDFDLSSELWIIDLMNSLFMVGFAVGCSIFGQVSDLYGRKWVFIPSFFLMLVFGFCGAFCQNWKIFMALRVLVGVSVGASGVTAFALLIENLGMKYWASIGMIYTSFFSIGMMILSLCGYLLQHWRKVCVVCSVPGFFLVPVYAFLIPESPRWLYHVGKLNDAQKVLLRIGRKNGKALSIADIPLSNANQNINSSRRHTMKKYSLFDLFKVTRLTVYALCSFFVWFAASFFYYGLTFNASSLSPNIYMDLFLSGLIEIPAVVVAMFMMNMNWLGRKGSVIILLLVSVSSTIILLFADALKSENLPTLILVLGLTSKLAVAGVFGIIYVYVSEIFPTQLRLLAIGGSSMFARFGAIISPFVPLLAPYASFLPYVIFGVVAMAAACTTMYLPETLKRRTPDMGDFFPETPNKSNQEGIGICEPTESDHLLTQERRLVV